MTKPQSVNIEKTTTPTKAAATTTTTTAAIAAAEQCDGTGDGCLKCRSYDKQAIVQMIYRQIGEPTTDWVTPLISDESPCVRSRIKSDPQRAFRDKQRRLYAWLRGERDNSNSTNANGNDDGGARAQLPAPKLRQFVISDCRQYDDIHASVNNLNEIGLSIANNQRAKRNKRVKKYHVHDYGSDDSISSTTTDDSADDIGPAHGDSDYYYLDDDNGSVCNIHVDTTNDNDTVTDGEWLAKKQARDLQQFISDPEDTIRLSHRQQEAERRRQAKRRVRRGFFENPGECKIVRYQTEEEAKSEWVVVSIELDRTESCDSELDDNLLNLIQESADADSTEKPEVPTESNETDLPESESTEQPVNANTAADEIIVEANADANVATDATPEPLPDTPMPMIEEDYGLIYTRNRFLRRLLRLFKFIDFDIRFGRALQKEEQVVTDSGPKTSLSSLIEAGINRRTAERRKKRREARLKRREKAREALKPKPEFPSYYELVKTGKVYETLIWGGSRPDFMFSNAPEKEPESKPFCIAKHFGLNDDGDIIVHMDHVLEEKGSASSMRSKRRRRRRSRRTVPRPCVGVEMREYKKFALKLRLFWRDLVKTIKCGK